MRSSFGRFGMRETGLPSAVVKTNELIKEHVYTRELVLVYTCIAYM